MYKIGDFSKMSKVTIKTLRYYEKIIYLIDTCLNGQDNYEKMTNFFLEDSE